jgi:putative CocE/NonD family hydrolase
MRIRSDFARRVRTIPNTWITLADGIRLAARIWLPEDAESDPVPAILEYIPYRKDDGTATRDAIMHPWFAGHGYAAVRVDQRGSGDSDGLLLDEYLPQEQDDALEVLAWLAAQPWCTGRIGIIGKSWGGFNGLQIAARRPPELGGVISVCSTDDRYATDVHYMGGCLLGADMLPWASTMLAFNARPPDPAAVGDRWRELWLERLEGTPPFAQTWIAHQRRDAFWKHGSVCEDFDAIEVPVYMVGGWQDAYTDAVFRFLGGYGGPARGLVGPWGHLYPQSGAPGPAIGFLQECLRFWDHCLKDEQNGALDGPALRVYLQEWVDPTAGRHAQRPGRWVAEPSWPPLDSAPLRVLHLRADAALGEQPGEDAELAIAGSQLTGLHSGPWCGWGAPGDEPGDQRAEDGRSLCFTSQPLAERLEILGFPEAQLTLASDRPLALCAVRLCDVAPSGSSLLVTRGLLNLTHRDSHESPRPLEPGRRYEVAVRLGAIAHAFPPGHRIRVAVSPTYWPFAWPSPEPVTLTLVAGAASRLQLPVRAARDEDDALPPFEEPEISPPLTTERIGGGLGQGRELTHDLATGRAQLTVRTEHNGAYRLVEADLEIDETAVDTYGIVEGDPLSASVRCAWSIGLARDGWRTRVDTSSSLTSDASSFLLTDTLDAYEGERRVFSKRWSVAIPRDLV